VSRRPHVLLLGMQFPPARGSGVYRIRAWANDLVARGLDVTVLAARDDYWRTMSGDIDEHLRTTVDPRVRVVQVPIPYEHLRQDVRSMSWLHANFPRAYIKAHAALRDKIFPEVYAPVLPTFVAHGLVVHLRHKVDLVLATGNPYAQYGAAHLLGRILSIPYIVDYHDPWTLDLWKEEDAFPPGHAALKWERRIVNDASLVITVNQPLIEWYRERYPHIAPRLRLVENGLAEDVVSVPAFQPVKPDRPLRAAFLGTIRADLPLEEYLDGWELARKEPELTEASMDFYGYLGFFSQHAEQIRSRIERGDAQGVRYRGPVSQTQIANVFSEVNLLAMLLTSSRYVTAGKGYDYMASGRPVVGVHDKRNDTTQTFADYPLFFGVEQVTPEAVRDALVAGARAARCQTMDQFEACRAEALRHTWRANMAVVGAELKVLSHA
jgi:hypothetical protein